MQAEFWIMVAGLFAAGTVLAGFYPAIILSSFKPIAVLKGKIMQTKQGNVLRKSLVVFQFVASVVLISGSIIVYMQLNFMRNQDLGIDINQKLIIKGPGATDSTYASKQESFRNEVLRISGVKSMTSSSNIPGDEIFWANGIRRLVGGPESTISGYALAIDYDYIPAFGLKLAAGRGYDRNYTNENKNIILNEAMTEALDFADPKAALGEKVIHGRDTFEIVGVLENYHQMSLKETVGPLVFRFSPDNSSFYVFKIEGNHKEILAAMEGPWKTFFPGNPLDYFFLDQFFNRQYEKDRQFGNVFSLFTGLAIFVACLGLFGLASFLTLQRTKEIGVRKVLGSTVTQIVMLLSKGFIQLVVIANLIAWPLAWWLMDRWLQTFPYHITINPLLFVAAGAGVILIAFLSISMQTLKAARSNPAQTLKYE